MKFIIIFIAVCLLIFILNLLPPQFGFAAGISLVTVGIFLVNQG